MSNTFWIWIKIFFFFFFFYNCHELGRIRLGKNTFCGIAVHVWKFVVKRTSLILQILEAALKQFTTDATIPVPLTIWYSTCLFWGMLALSVEWVVMNQSWFRKHHYFQIFFRSITIKSIKTLVPWYYLQPLLLLFCFACHAVITIVSVTCLCVYNTMKIILTERINRSGTCDFCLPFHHLQIIQQNNEMNRWMKSKKNEITKNNHPRKKI